MTNPASDRRCCIFAWRILIEHVCISGQGQMYLLESFSYVVFNVLFLLFLLSVAGCRLMIDEGNLIDVQIWAWAWADGTSVSLVRRTNICI